MPKQEKPGAASGDGSAHAPRRQQDATSGNPSDQTINNQPLECGLYVVATPIGNLEDITLRAVRVLGQADEVACEDTRVTGKLLKHLCIKQRLVSYNDHNGERVRPNLLRRLKSGGSIALVSDAGTPLISDPGLKLVQACIENNIRVFPIPGASAVLAGLVVSGLPTDRVMFVGFLPSKSAARRSALNTLKAIPATLVFYETGPRMAKSLADMADILGERSVSVGRELTKHYETVTHGLLPELAETHGSSPAPKGELVIVVAPPDESQTHAEIDIDAALIEALKTKSVRDAATDVADITGQPRRHLYNRAVTLSQEQRGDPKR